MEVATQMAIIGFLIYSDEFSPNIHRECLVFSEFILMNFLLTFTELYFGDISGLIQMGVFTLNNI